MTALLEQMEAGWGLRLVEWFQGGGRGVLWYLLFPLHIIGSEFGVMLILAGVFWAVDRKAGIRLMMLVLGSQTLSNTFKVWWGRPRPYHVAPQRIIPVSESWQPGLPSWHTIFGTTAGLWFANTVRRTWSVIVGIGVALIMGISRMVHGVHYPQDVIAGLVIGAAFFGVFIAAERLVDRRSPQWRPLPVLLATTGFLVLAFIAALATSDDFEARKSILAPAAALAGGVAGLLVERSRLAMSTDGPVSKRLLRIAVGIPLLAGMALGLSELFYLIVGASESIPTLILYVVRYGLLGAVVTLGAPWLFTILGVADRGGAMR